MKTDKIKGCLSTYEPVEFNKKGVPNNTIPVQLHLCADSRSSECPYVVEIKIDTEWISFKQKFCGYKYKKDK